MSAFQAKAFLPASVLARLTDARVNDPETAWRLAQTRPQRAPLTTDGRLNILAADHPARRVTGIGNDSLALTNRHDYLARIMRVLQCTQVDGVMATMDVLEDLLVLDDFLRQAGRPVLLDGKLLIASFNRGGLAGVAWEMDDPLTGANAQTCLDWNLDGAKLLLRLCDDEPASLNTLMASAQAINETNALRLPMFLEPLPVVKTEAGYKVVKTAEALAKIVGVASALGDSSRYLWLKLPYCDGYEAVARATTLPILLLGGEAVGAATPLLREIAGGLAAGANVRGALVGRNVLYPGATDPLIVATAIGGIIHNNWTVAAAIENANAELSRADSGKPFFD
ncbi:MAG: deoxyribose-phosphate aldolase [Acidobacteria bacterium]|nr:deoxyribose-phosphate aldolase [Acidobacteriota bacterium]MBI3427617.1 deoxyribose-phosphate aldolase [Acidobacteriota bacterium]